MTLTSGPLGPLGSMQNAAELILPYLRDRPLTMKRMPDGVTGGFFYEKTAPSHTPDWISRCPVRSEDSKDGIIGYLMVNDLATLLFVANLGCIEMHPLHSRCGSVDSPDYLFFDLDPMEAPFDSVLRVAAPRQGVARHAGARELPEDERCQRRPDLRAGRARLLVRAGTRIRRHGRTMSRRPIAGT